MSTTTPDTAAVPQKAIDFFLSILAGLTGKEEGSLKSIEFVTLSDLPDSEFLAEIDRKEGWLSFMLNSNPLGGFKYSKDSKEVYFVLEEGQWNLRDISARLRFLAELHRVSNPLIDCFLM